MLVKIVRFQAWALKIEFRCLKIVAVPSRDAKGFRIIDVNLRPGLVDFSTGE